MEKERIDEIIQLIDSLERSCPRCNGDCQVPYGPKDSDRIMPCPDCGGQGDNKTAKGEFNKSLPQIIKEILLALAGKTN